MTDSPPKRPPLDTFLWFVLGMLLALAVGFRLIEQLGTINQ